MLFNSPVFLFGFLPLTLLVFALIDPQRRWRRAMAWLVAASLFFHAWWMPAVVALLLASVAFNYAMGRAIEACPGRAGGWLAAAGVTGNLVLLGWFKYAGLLAETINALTGAGVPVPQVILPLGISFFTFQQIAYLVDTRTDRRAERDPLKYALFITFFPHLIAGPIVHHKVLLSQFTQGAMRRFNWPDMAAGLMIFIIGLTKKVALADSIAPFANHVFTSAANGQPLTTASAWVGTICYALQIYFDFSGYSDMAIGLGRMFGIRIPLNFNSPYKADSIIVFWRCWHMTLSRFLRDYLYIPLGGNTQGASRRYLNLSMTMLLGGLWHGASWTFVAWGGLHGLYLMINHAWRALKVRLGWGDGGIMARIAGVLLTFAAINVAWVFFRAESFETAMVMLKTMAGLENLSLPASLSVLKPFLPAGVRWNGLFADHALPPPSLAWMAALLAVAWICPNTQTIMRAIEPSSDWHPLPGSRVPAWRPDPVWAMAGAVCLTVSLLSLSRISEFIYFNF